MGPQGVAGFFGQYVWMRKQYNFWRGANGVDAWDVERLVELSARLPVREVELDSIDEIDTAYWFDLGTARPTVRTIVEHVRRRNPVLGARTLSTWGGRAQKPDSSGGRAQVGVKPGDAGPGSGRTATTLPAGGRARRGVSGSLYPQSAYEGLNSRLRSDTPWFRAVAETSMAGSRARRPREPGQVREEAALSGPSPVPWECLA